MDPRLAHRFGGNLRRARRRADLSQVQLARLVELNRVDVGQLERGRRLPRLDTILKLSAGVEQSSCVLLAGLRWRPGYYVNGGFCVDDPSEASAAAKRGAR
ncbi:MAG TPA: helix-turn-helix transcriptional regulator [Solirubrobacterales bacterium]|nr:helix-turn-helix transcriptional regulator [Solirubrobacterales bacterium]